jgi:hypothetical protein
MEVVVLSILASTSSMGRGVLLVLGAWDEVRRMKRML